MAVSCKPHTPTCNALNLTMCVRYGRKHWMTSTGKTYDQRYDEYEAEYDKYAQACQRSGEPLAPKVRRKGGYHAISATKSVSKQLAELDALRQQGIVRQSPPSSSTIVLDT